jgi:hypothetical protein
LSTEKYTYAPSDYAYDYYDNRPALLAERAEKSSVAPTYYYGVAEASMEIERLGTDSSGTWIRTFLINHEKNKRGWKIDRSTSFERAKTAIGKPLVINEDPISGRIDHPQYQSLKSVEANERNHARYEVATIKKVFYNPNNDSYYADSVVTHPRFRDYINSHMSKNISIPVSPQILYNPAEEEPNHYKNWTLSHLAVVDQAAYGPVAKAIGTCNGSEQKCSRELQAAAVASASLSGLVDIPSCYGGRQGIIAPPNGKRKGVVA